jgi:hypothetical protein
MEVDFGRVGVEMTYLRGLRPCKTLEGMFLADNMRLRGEQAKLPTTTSTKFAASLLVSTLVLLNAIM